MTRGLGVVAAILVCLGLGVVLFGDRPDNLLLTPIPVVNVVDPPTGGQATTPTQTSTDQDIEGATAHKTPGSQPI